MHVQYVKQSFRTTAVGACLQRARLYSAGDYIDGSHYRVRVCVSLFLSLSCSLSLSRVCGRLYMSVRMGMNNSVSVRLHTSGSGSSFDTFTTPRAPCCSMSARTQCVSVHAKRRQLASRSPPVAEPSLRSAALWVSCEELAGCRHLHSYFSLATVRRDGP